MLEKVQPQQHALSGLKQGDRFAEARLECCTSLELQVLELRVHERGPTFKPPPVHGYTVALLLPRKTQSYPQGSDLNPTDKGTTSIIPRDSRRLAMAAHEQFQPQFLERISMPLGGHSRTSKSLPCTCDENTVEDGHGRGIAIGAGAGKVQVARTEGVRQALVGRGNPPLHDALKLAIPPLKGHPRPSRVSFIQDCGHELPP